MENKKTTEAVGLSDEQAKKIFNERIKIRYFSDGVKSVENPKAVFLAGQPGAGKNKLAEETLKGFKTNAIIVDMDELRKYHPDFGSVKDQYSLDADTRKFKTLLLDECIKNKCNVIFDGTLGGQLKYVEAEMQNMKDSGYSIKINALAVNDSISKLGFVSRYEKQVSEQGQGRNVDLSYHNEIYKNIPNNITELIGKGKVDEMTLYKRNHQSKKTEAFKYFGTETFKSAKDIPIIEFNKERNRPLNQYEIKELAKWYKETLTVAEKNNSNISNIKEIIKTDDPRAPRELKNNINEIKGENLNLNRNNRLGL